MLFIQTYIVDIRYIIYYIFIYIVIMELLLHKRIIYMIK